LTGFEAVSAALAGFGTGFLAGGFFTAAFFGFAFAFGAALGFLFDFPFFAAVRLATFFFGALALARFALTFFFFRVEAREVAFADFFLFVAIATLLLLAIHVGVKPEAPI
jgi:hypothetical protein